jgi:stearoyl-CoA desaturase (delta-9 desaturase)
LDLLTPAHRWATAEQSADRAAVDPAPHAHRMPLPQQLTMFFSVVGPIAGLVTAMALLWHHGPASIGWPEIIAMIGMYTLCGFGVTIGFHRLFTHRSFETNRFVRTWLATFGSMAGQGALIRWCATHRRHHQQADRHGDPHSPHVHGDTSFEFLRGMWHAHMGWLFHRDCEGTARSIPDLMNDPALVLIDRLYFPIVFLGILIPGAFVAAITHTWYGFFSGMIWGGVMRICLLQHVTWSINSVCHVWGRRPFKSGDESANNWIFGLLALGEGWHNNHHAFPRSAIHGLDRWQFDFSAWVIQTLEQVRLVTDQRAARLALVSVRFVVAAHSVDGSARPREEHSHAEPRGDGSEKGGLTQFASRFTASMLG